MRSSLKNSAWIKSPNPTNTMNICDDNHEEVCYSGRDCPVCKALEDVTSIESDLDSAEARIETLQDKIAELESNAASA